MNIFKKLFGGSAPAEDQRKSYNDEYPDLIELLDKFIKLMEWVQSHEKGECSYPFYDTIVQEFSIDPSRPSRDMNDIISKIGWLKAHDLKIEPKFYYAKLVIEVTSTAPPKSTCERNGIDPTKIIADHNLETKSQFDDEMNKQVTILQEYFNKEHEYHRMYLIIDILQEAYRKGDTNIIPAITRVAESYGVDVAKVLCKLGSDPSKVDLPLLRKIEPAVNKEKE